MYYFYDFKENKMKGCLDNDQRFILAWNQKGCFNKFRILNLKTLHDFYSTLDSNYSRVIHYFPPSGDPWITYIGHQGDGPQNLNAAISNINWNQQYYGVIFKRSACGFRMNILPKSVALTEYQLYKPSIGLTKLLVRISDGYVENYYGCEVKEAEDYYNSKIGSQQIYHQINFLIPQQFQQTKSAKMNDLVTEMLFSDFCF